MFNIDEFIIVVYLCVDAHLESLLTRYPPRRRGFAPGLRDSEVLTLEMVGEFLGHPDDSAIGRYFRRHWRDWFPGLGHRSTLYPASREPLAVQTMAASATDSSPRS